MTTRSTIFSGDPFAELGVPDTATHDEVRRAFRRRARETHPDHRPDDPHAAQRFARLRHAYEEALERIKSDDHRARSRAERPDRAAEAAKRGKGITEYELSLRVEALRDPGALRRVLARHGHRPLIGAVLARNPAFPADALATLRTLTENHWTVEAAIAARPDAPTDILRDIASSSRETVIGQAVAGNVKSGTETLDALVSGPIRLDASLENALASHPALSTEAAARLAGRHATAVPAVLRLVDRGDLPEELLYRLAAQSTRPLVASAARRDLMRRGLSAPPPRGPQRPPKTMTGYFR